MIYKVNFSKIITERQSVINDIKLLNISSVLYRIQQISINKCYIGTSKNIIKRLYNDHHGYVTLLLNKRSLRSIHKAILEYGYNDFELIIEISNSYNIISPLEEEYINKYDSYYNGYNETKTGKSNNKSGVTYNTKGKIFIYNPDTNEELMINPDEFSNYLGFEKGHKPRKSKGSTLGLIWINNGIINNMIKKTDDIPEGWSLGKIKQYPSGMAVINDGSRNYNIPIELLDEKLSLGYKRGRINSPNKGRVAMSKGDIVKYVTKDKVDLMIKDGYIRGNNNKKKNK